MAALCRWNYGSALMEALDLFVDVCVDVNID
jgi:hypothetical protein